MLVSRDHQEISVLECILGGLHIDVDVEPEPRRAFQKLSRSKVDALIVDSDLQGTHSLLIELNKGTFQKSVPLVIVSGTAGHPSDQAAPASFHFAKPISVDQAVRVLSSARNMILDGRLRYHRQVLDLPAVLKFSKGKVNATIMNLSQGGVGVIADSQLPVSTPLQVRFSLPHSRQKLELKGEVVWGDAEGRGGIRFVDISKDVQHNLQIWLERQYFESNLR